MQLSQYLSIMMAPSILNRAVCVAMLPHVIQK